MATVSPASRVAFRLAFATLSVVVLMAFAGRATAAAAPPPAPAPVAPVPSAPPAAQGVAWPAEVPADLDRRVDRALGKILAERPPIQAVDAAAMAASMRADLIQQALAGGAPQAMAEKAAEQSGPMITAIAGKTIASYSPSAKAIFFQPSAVDRLVETKAIEASLREKVLVLALVRELAQALQDQEIGLARFLAAPGVDGRSLGTEAMYARRAVSEGQALLAVELVAEEWAQEDPSWRAAKDAAIAAFPGGSANATAGVPDRDRQREATIYGGGLRVMRSTQAINGAKATWKMFAEPPADLTPFERGGEGFDPELSQRLATALDAGLAAFGEGWTGKAKASSPQVALSPQMPVLTTEGRERLIRACKAVAAMAGIERKGGRAMVVAFRASDEEAAQLLWGELAAMNAKAMQTLGLANPERMQEDAGGTSIDIARQSMTVNGQQVGLSFTRMRRGTTIVQFSLVNSLRELTELRAIGERLLGELERVEAGQRPAETK